MERIINLLYKTFNNYRKVRLVYTCPKCYCPAGFQFHPVDYDLEYGHIAEYIAGQCQFCKCMIRVEFNVCYKGNMFRDKDYKVDTVDETFEKRMEPLLNKINKTEKEVEIQKLKLKNQKSLTKNDTNEKARLKLKKLREKLRELKLQERKRYDKYDDQSEKLTERLDKKMEKYNIETPARFDSRLFKKVKK
jgi:hypothetical protein